MLGTATRDGCADMCNVQEEDDLKKKKNLSLLNVLDTQKLFGLHSKWCSSPSLNYSI